MKKALIICLIISTSYLYSNDWEIDTDGLSMSVITGYEISNNRKFDIHRNEYYDDNGRVLLKIKFSSNGNGDEYWREIFKYDNEGRIIENSTWSKERDNEWRRNGYMKTEYYEEGENFIVIESGEVYYRTIIKDSEDRIISIENTVSYKDGSEDYSYVEYTYEKTIDGFLRQIGTQENRIFKIDYLYNDDNKVLKKNIVLDDPDLINITEHRYDVNGNVIETYLYHKYRYAGYRTVFKDGKPVREELTEEEKEAIHFRKQTIQYEYDDLGRLLIVTTNGESDCNFSHYPDLKNNENLSLS